MKKLKAALRGDRGRTELRGPVADTLDAQVNSYDSGLILQNEPSNVYIPPSPQFPFGVKVWYDCPHATVDICFIHGLAGNRDTTWTAPTQTLPWPRILLGPRMERARILSYGYDAYVVRKSVASNNRLTDHATSLLNDLTGDRVCADASSRALIFVAHSLGGLVVKETLLLSRNNPDAHLRGIFDYTKAIIFMGTPHTGSWMADWAKLPASALGLVKSTNTSLLKILQTDDQFLASIQTRFLQMVRELRESGGRRLEITCFVEELALPGVGIVVSRASASLEGYNNQNIRANHRDMVRFSSPEDQNYKRVLMELFRWEGEVRLGITNPGQIGQMGHNRQLVVDTPPPPSSPIPLRAVYAPSASASAPQLAPASSVNLAELATDTPSSAFIPSPVSNPNPTPILAPNTGSAGVAAPVKASGQAAYASPSQSPPERPDNMATLNETRERATAFENHINAQYGGVSGHVFNFYGETNLSQTFSNLGLSSASTTPSDNNTTTLSVPPPAEDNALVQKLSSACCCFCENCKSGIAYYSDSFICMECKLWVCQSCHKTHNRMHQPRVRLQMRQWTEAATEFSPTADCNSCSAEARARLQCASKDCGHALCIECMLNPQTREKFLQTHLSSVSTHRMLYAIFPTHWFTLGAWRIKPCYCTSLNRPAVLGHCHRCHAPWDFSTMIYGCRDCKINFGVVQWLCQTCFLEPYDDNLCHKREHEFAKCSIIYDPNLPDDHVDRYYCQTCPRWLAEGEQIEHKHPKNEAAGSIVPHDAHPSPDYLWVSSPKLKDTYRLLNYRTCDKILCIHGSVQHPDKMIWKCVQCQFVLAYNKPATICLKAKCTQWIYCASCTEAARINHRHQNSTYTVLMQKRVNNPLPVVDCAKCRQRYKKTTFLGIICDHCRQFSVCWSCIRATSNQGNNELVDRLPHFVQPNIHCVANKWLLIFEGAK